MTFKISDLFKATGLATGANNVNLAAAGGLVKLQAAVSKEAEKLGAKIGQYTGGNIFSALEKGAKGADTIATDKLVADNTGYSLTGIKTWAIVAAVVAVAWFFLRRSK